MGLDLRRGPRPGRPAAGFSLVEALLATLIVVVVVLGLLPLFTRAARSNFQGAESTSVANMAVSRAEEFFQFPFDNPSLTIASGTTENTFDEVWTKEDAGWIAGTAATATAGGKTPLWTRQTVVRQYNVNDILDGEPLTPLDGDTPLTSVHLKEIRVAVAGTRLGGPLGGGQALSVQLFKSQ
jgi:type II secretory pathway pseudopilin PulG